MRIVYIRICVCKTKKVGDRSLKTQLLYAFSNVAVIDCRLRKCSVSKKSHIHLVSYFPESSAHTKCNGSSRPTGYVLCGALGHVLSHSSSSISQFWAKQLTKEKESGFKFLSSILCMVPV